MSENFSKPVKGCFFEKEATSRLSFRRKPESRKLPNIEKFWTPAFAGVTAVSGLGFGLSPFEGLIFSSLRLCRRSGDYLEDKIEEQFKHIQFSQIFINLVSQKVRKFYEKAKTEKEREKKILPNKKMAVEKKRDIAEEKLIAGVLDNDDFIRISDRFKKEIILLKNEIDVLDAQREMDTETVRKVLLISRDIYQVYKTAPCELKRLYWSFFWDGFWVRGGKIIKAKANKLIEALLQENLVQIRSNLLPSSDLFEPWKTGIIWLY